MMVATSAELALEIMELTHKIEATSDPMRKTYMLGALAALTWTRTPEALAKASELVENFATGQVLLKAGPFILLSPAAVR